VAPAFGSRLAGSIGLVANLLISALARAEPYAYSALRIVSGSLFVFHGFQKLFGMFGGQEVELLSRLGAAGVIEVVAGTLIAIGLATVPAAVVASGEMAFAYFLAHAPKGGWPIENGGELAVLYGFLFLFIATHGPGPISLDRLLRR
jgi:putative oxidoreductase